MTKEERLRVLQEQIKPLADKEDITEDEVKELKSLMAQRFVNIIPINFFLSFDNQ